MAAWSWAEAMAAAELLLLRHGVAIDRQLAADRGLDDEARALTAAGRRRTAAVVRRLVTLGLAVDPLLTSPLLRAHQTAELAREGGLALHRFEVCGELAPGGDPAPLLERWFSAGGEGAERPSPWRRLALVGHEPDLSELACRLCGAPPGALRLRKAGVVVLALPWQAPVPSGGSGEARGWEAALGRTRLTLLLSPRALLGEG
jgi:phosphohistidine phosphatase